MAIDLQIARKLNANSISSAMETRKGVAFGLRMQTNLIRAIIY